MPKKAKEKTEELNTKTATKKSATKVAVTKKTNNKKTTAQKTTAKKATTKASAKKADTTKNVAKKATQKTSEKMKEKTKNSKIKAVHRTKKASVSTTSTEYYDLPFRYNQTLVKILAQTPNMLFIYWDISDADRQAFEKQYGDNFFQITRPVLIISNTTLNYTFEVEINDFANSWYLHINDASCDYRVELGRRFKINSTDNTTVSYHTNEYLYITASNTIEAPNNHILLDQLGKSVFFRNVKTNFIEERSISSLSYLQNLGRIYDIYDLYKELYKDELILDHLSLNLPSSNSSPTYK